jgi:enamine deaminase RidA (YjgF/YER057c/UK114 family)
MNTLLNPASLAAPAARYSLAVLSESPARLLHTAGIVAGRPDGTVPDDLGEQAELIWSAVAALLAEAAMTTTDIVSITTYVVAGHDLSVVMAARDRAMAGHLPASTLIVVPALARPEWRMEIAVIAAR